VLDAASERVKTAGELIRQNDGVRDKLEEELRGMGREFEALSHEQAGDSARMHRLGDILGCACGITYAYPSDNTK
jgi:hypothetical protein